MLLRSGKNTNIMNNIDKICLTHKQEYEYKYKYLLFISICIYCVFILNQILISNLNINNYIFCKYLFK